jgi:putative transposase
VSKRISPAERLRAEIDGVFAGGEDLSRAIERVAQLGAQLLLQSALEAEVAVFLGRDRYERAASREDARVGMRNGYCPTTVKTTAGPVTLARPKLRGSTERFASRLFGTRVTKTNALESLVIAGFVRGLSTRDVEAALVEALGESAAVSKSTVSRICAEIKTQFEAWSARRLDDVELDYLFLDGSHFKYHANASAEPVLAAWGIDTDGKPVFVGLEAASSESGDAWEGFLTGLGERGLALPAAGDLRRRAWADRGRRTHHGRRAPATLSDPSRAKRAGQGAQKRAGASQSGLLGDLRSAQGRRARPGRGESGPEPD